MEVQLEKMREDYLSEVKMNSNQNFIKLFSLQTKIKESQFKLVTMSLYKEKLLEKIEFSFNKFIFDLDSLILSQESKLEPSTSESHENKKRKRKK
jgi:hypothetical protein